MRRRDTSAPAIDKSESTTDDVQGVEGRANSNADRTKSILPPPVPTNTTADELKPLSILGRSAWISAIR